MFFFILLFNSELFSQDSDSILNNTNNSKNQLLKKTEVLRTPFDSLMSLIDCDDSNYDKKIAFLKRDIEFKLSSMINKLTASKLDTKRSAPLISLLKIELKTYDESVENEASILFWSYGIASMQGERVTSRRCLYLRSLRRKQFFISAINEKVFFLNSFNLSIIIYCLF